MSPASAPARPATDAPTKRRRPLWARVLGWLALTLAVLALVGVGVVAYLYSTIDIPEPNRATQAQISTVYFADGQTEMGRLSGGTNRENVSLSDVPPHVQKAFLAAEDRSFYSNKGVSLTGIGRAVKVALEGGATQGGSTITQQYVKNTFLTSDQTVQRKVKEIIISVKLDQQRSKDQILEDYLNTIYFGRGASGIQTASKAYFNKDVQQLTPAEGALLASVIRGPSIYDPARSATNLARSKERVSWILDGMVEQGWLSPAERSKAVYPTVVKAKPLEVTGGTNGYLVDMVRKELTSQVKLDDDQIKKGGLRIVTTIDKKYQDAMIEAINDRGASDDIPGAQTGMAAIKPGTGEIQALYGGEDFAKRPYNNAVDAHLSAGSTFKAYTTVAALENGYSTKSKVSGSSPFQLPGSTTEVENEYNQQYGFIDIRQALADSVNTAFVRMNVKIGPAATHKAAVQAGIPDSKQVNIEDVPVNTLGTATPSVLDNTNGYATITAEGKRATPHMIKTAESADGAIDYTAGNASTQAIPRDVAVDAIDALTYPIQEGTATYAQRLNRPAMGKTGTAEDHKEVWFIGSVPQLTAGCAIYKPAPDGASNEPLGRNVGGYKYCVPIWTQFMRTVMAGQPEQSFPDRVGLNDDNRQNFGRSPRSTSTAQASDPNAGTGGIGGQGTTTPTSSAPAVPAPAPTASAPAPSAPAPSQQPPSPRATVAPPAPTTPQPPAPTATAATAGPPTPAP
ncbi:transglycosylase domain-containing protein [Arsenicicoccus sp. oral taxon 190]|uniref:transglycosylase domain-containing protein n=1 Tax=Arsenicicoccus sp. oral taxon 190 TaxID=1658671 RepID=UPI00067E2E11|nr:transglycosylase domain-containing protein [Arsenicicoccus sp. oral taxon 190]